MASKDAAIDRDNILFCNVKFACWFLSLLINTLDTDRDFGAGEHHDSWRSLD